MSALNDPRDAENNLWSPVEVRLSPASGGPDRAQVAKNVCFNVPGDAEAVGRVQHTACCVEALSGQRNLVLVLLCRGEGGGSVDEFHHDVDGLDIWWGQRVRNKPRVATAPSVTLGGCRLRGSCGTLYRGSRGPSRSDAARRPYCLGAAWGRLQNHRQALPHGLIRKTVVLAVGCIGVEGVAVGVNRGCVVRDAVHADLGLPRLPRWRPGGRFRVPTSDDPYTIDVSTGTAVLDTCRQGTPCFVRAILPTCCHVPAWQ